MGRLENKRILITGAAGGIGLACARAAVREGARLVLSCRNPGPIQADPLLRELPCITADMESSGEIGALFAQAEKLLGGLDGLLHSAGVESSHGFLETDEEHFCKVINVNLTGAFLCAREAARLMNTGGSIVFVSSQKGLTGSLGSLAYNASKGGVTVMARSMALELGPLGIRVNCLCPGPTDTPMLRRDVNNSPDSGALLETIRKSNPLGRIAQADEMAGGALFLLGDESSFMTGSELVLDGGNVAGARRLG